MRPWLGPPGVANTGPVVAVGVGTEPGTGVVDGRWLNRTPAALGDAKFHPPAGRDAGVGTMGGGGPSESSATGGSFFIDWVSGRPATGFMKSPPRARQPGELGRTDAKLGSSCNGVGVGGIVKDGGGTTAPGMGVAPPTGVGVAPTLAPPVVVGAAAGVGERRGVTSLGSWAAS